MSKIGFLTDSCSDIPQELADKYGIEVVGFPINLDGVEYMALEPIIEDPEEELMDAAELVFLKVSEETDEDGEAFLDTIQDDEEFERVAEVFRDKLSEEYDFLDEDEEE